MWPSRLRFVFGWVDVDTAPFGLCTLSVVVAAGLAAVVDMAALDYP